MALKMEDAIEIEALDDEIKIEVDKVRSRFVTLTEK